MGNSWSATATSTPTGLRRSEKTKSFLFTFEDYTEDAPDDEKIRREIAGLQVAIINHARDYHHQGPIRCAVVEIEKLLRRERQPFPNLSTIEFAQLLCDTATRRSAITGLISHMLLKNIGFYGSKEHTLLSPSVVGCIREFEVGDADVQLMEGRYPLKFSKLKTYIDIYAEEEMAFAQWRAVTAHLLPKRRKDQQSENERVTRRVDRLTKLIDDILINFYDSRRDNQERLQSLTGIVTKAAVVGEMIFASPSRWRFDWNPSRRDLRDRHTQNKKAKSTGKYHRRDTDGTHLALVRFPAVVQTCTQDLSSSQAHRRKRVGGDYDNSSTVFNILKEARTVSGTAKGDPSEIGYSSTSESRLSTASPHKSERG